MELTKENIEEWKKELDHLAINSPLRHSFSDTLSDDEWLKENLGDDTTDVIDTEIYYARQD